MFPFALLLLREKPHFGWFSLDAPAIFYGAHIAVELLDFVQGVLLVFAVSGLKAGGILQLRTLEGVAEIRIGPCAMVFEDHEFFIEHANQAAPCWPV